MTKTYLEYDLPLSLQEALDRLKRGLELSKDGKYTQLDLDYDEVNSCINTAEVGQRISSEQAWYLRERYLGIKREDIC